MSQASYPIKGIHTLIKYFGVLKNKYHLDFIIQVSGKSLFSNNFLYNLVYLSSYGLYVLMLTKIYNVKLNFLGRLNAESVKFELLKSHLFISSSLIENSSNAIGEAMITLIPILANDVGGTTSLIKDHLNGFIYSTSIKDDFLEKFLYIYNNYDKVDLTWNQKKYSNLFYNQMDNYISLFNVYEQIHQNS
jgi:glycosyltransferase involved in cell wall biosynthesis